MVTWEGLSFQKDLIPTLSLLARLVEAGHHEVQVSGQGPHDCDLGLESSDDRRDQFCGMVIDVEEWC